MSTDPDRSAGIASTHEASVTSAQDALTALRHHEPEPQGPMSSPLSTGFDLLDRVLEGGMRVHDLVLIGGGPGVGKTIAALQMARNIAANGRPVVYVSYEHDAPTMIGRLLALELGEVAQPDLLPELDRLRDVAVQCAAGFRSLEAAIREEPLLAQAASRVDSYAHRLTLVRASGRWTDTTALESLVRDHGADGGGVLFVDYLQKVAMQPEPDQEAEKVTRVVEDLKDLALQTNVAVVAVAASDWDGLKSGRMRLHHLRGSSALVYECDVAIILNEKHHSVSRDHLVYDPVKAERFKQQVIFTIEKNRGGPAMVDLEHQKNFLHYRFDPQGSYLAERLADDRIQAT